MKREPNRAERVLALLQACAPGWVPAVDLETPGGRQAWRTAVSEARTIAKASGGDIENRVRTFRVNGDNWTLSEYRYVPPTPIAENTGHDLNVGFQLR